MPEPSETGAPPRPDAASSAGDAASSPETRGAAPAGDAPAAAREPLPAQPPARDAAAGLAMPLGRALLYWCASLVFGITQGLGINLVTANLPALQGYFGVTSVEASAVTAAYYATSATASLVLFKIRFQFGLRIFAELGLVLFIIVQAAHLLANDLPSAVMARAVLGLVAAPLTSIAVLYAFEPLPQARRFTLGLCIGLAGSQLAAPLARIISPDLLQAAGDWQGLYLFEIGLACLCLPLLYLLPLTPPPRMVLFDRMDLVSLPLLALGFGLVVVAATFGPILWWTSVPWIGACLAAGILCLALVVAVELNRARPTINLRWISTFDILSLAGALLVFRFLLSEQTFGVVQFLRLFGFTNEGEQALFRVILASTAAGYATNALIIRPGREPAIHIAALALIAVAAFKDAGATSLWRPEQFLVSQAMMGFAGGLFLPSAMLSGMRRAIVLGLPNLMSFVIVFAATQSVGGLISSAALQSFVTVRTQAQLQHMAAAMPATEPLVAGRVAQLGASYAPVLPDPALSRSQGMASFSQSVGLEAQVAAYRDLFALIGIVALAALAVLLVNTLLAAVRARAGADPPAAASIPAPAAPARPA
jgi:MFS family permease